MAPRKRILKKRPDFRLPKENNEQDKEDLKTIKAQALKDLEADEKNKKEWYDTELDKNLKNQ